MKITIDVPELKCTRCETTAPLQPVFLYAKGAVPPQFRDALTDIVKERADVHALDDGGRTWEAFADDKPVGWIAGPSSSDLCGPCGALWAESNKAFLVPPVPEPVAVEPAEGEIGAEAEAVVVPPPKAMTMSEMIASKMTVAGSPIPNARNTR